MSMSGHAIITADVDQGRLLLQVDGHADTLTVPVDTRGAIDDAPAWAAAIDEMIVRAPSAVPGLSSVVVRASEGGLVCIDAGGAVLYPVLWSHDDRSAPDAAWCRKKYDDAWWQAEVGLVPDFGHLVSKMSWLHRSEPDIWTRSRFLCSLEDYLRWHLVSSGAAGGFVTRPSVAASSGVWRIGAYREAVLSLIDAERNWLGVLPEVASEGSLLGSRQAVELRL